MTQIRKTRTRPSAIAERAAPLAICHSSTPAGDAALAPGTIAQILEDLEFATELFATAHAAAGTEDVNPEDLQGTLGFALERLRTGMERVRAMRAPTTKD